MEELIKELILKMQTGEFSLLFLAISFLGGVIASLSPCSLGVLPIIVAYVGGYGAKDDIENENNKSRFSELCFGLLCSLSSAEREHF